MTKPKPIYITANDLPLSCPMRSQKKTWGQHPRIFLDVQTKGSATCPYCNASYILKQDDQKNKSSPHPRS